MGTEVTVKPIDALIEAHYDANLAGKYGILNTLLQKEPNKEAIKEHPFAKGVLYLPIEKIEMMLRQIFGKFEVKVNDFKLIANSIAVHITLTVIDPITGEKINQDGLGAMPIQMDANSDPTDFSKIKNNAIMLALPSAESYAIKDAAEKLGKLFGADLNRKEKVYYQNIYPSLYEKSHSFIGYAEQLLNTSSYSEEERELMKETMSAPDLSVAELQNLVQRIKDNQHTALQKVQAGKNVSKTELNVAVTEAVNRDNT